MTVPGFSPRPGPSPDCFFRGLAEHAFHGTLGVVDPPLVEYLSALLVRFIRNDHLRPLPGGRAEAGDQLVMMLAAFRSGAGDHDEAGAVAPRGGQDRSGRAWHGVSYRHIGDYTLFWTGLYPEALRRRGQASRGGCLEDFRAAGKHAYWMASTREPATAAERSVFERLSRDYDTCAEGLAEVRRAWGES